MAEFDDSDDDRTPLLRRRLQGWSHLLRVTRRAEHHLREYLRVHFDTTLPRFELAAALYQSVAPLKMSALSQLLQVSNGNATTVVDRLEKDGWARRIPSPTDRRVVLVELTNIGRAQFEELAEAHDAELNRLFSELGHDELDLLGFLMRRLDGGSTAAD